MRKVLIGLLVVVMVLSLTACSQELADLMGKMSSNVYGIEADTSAATAAGEAVSSTVNEDKTINVTAENSAAVVSSVLAVQGSAQKTEALKTILNEKSDTTKENLVTAIDDTKIDVSKMEGDAKTVAETFNSLIESYKGKVESSEDYTPTKAEVATVMVLNSMSVAFQSYAEGATKEDEEKLITAGVDSVTALKVITEYGGINLIEDDDIMNILNSVSKDVSRADAPEDVDEYIKIVAPAVAKITQKITENGKFVKSKFESLVRESRALIISYNVIYGRTAKVDELVAIKGVGKPMILNDMLLYLLGNIMDGVDVSKLESFINENYAALMDLQNKFEDLDVATLKDLIKIDSADDKLILTCAAILDDSGFSSIYKVLNIETFTELRDMIQGN